MEYKYKTKGDVELVVPDVGVTVNGFITSTTPIENPNLELVVSETTETNPAPAHMTGVVEQAAQPVAQPIQVAAPIQITPTVESESTL